MKKLLNVIFMIAGLSMGKVYTAQSIQPELNQTNADFNAFGRTSKSIGKVNNAQSIQLPIPELTQTSADFKNIFARTKNLIIIRSLASSTWDSDPNSRGSYLEAYNIHTGDLVWRHATIGEIATFILVDEKVIYRNYQGLTALNSNNGAVIWSQKTQGYSTINDEN